jgi:hypothetical protein
MTIADGLMLLSWFIIGILYVNRQFNEVNDRLDKIDCKLEHPKHLDDKI